MSSSAVFRYVTAILASTAMLHAAEGAASPLFAEDQALVIELRGPISDLMAGRGQSEEFEFDLILAGADPLRLKVRSRGNSRLRLCAFPPLRLNFPKRDVQGTLFEGQNHLKLVTHCTDRRSDSGNVFDEYLAYRIFNLVSNLSYRVRLASLTYVDSAGGNDLPQKGWGFLIEAKEELAARTGTAPAEIAGIPYSRVDHDQAAVVYVFQYLIGNTDWSLVRALTDDYCCHNLDIFQSGEQYAIVPYDFDMSGLVDASYAKPDQSLQIRTVRVRRYRGYCTARDVVVAALTAIKALEASILEAARELPVTVDAEREQRIRYLGQFFEQAADADRLVARFERRCL